jgi:hypothetical protein
MIVQREEGLKVAKVLLEGRIKELNIALEFLRDQVDIERRLECNIVGLESVLELYDTLALEKGVYIDLTISIEDY